MNLKRVLFFATMISLVATCAHAQFPNAQFNVQTGLLQMVVDGTGNALGTLDITNNKGFISGVQTSTSSAGPWTAGNYATILKFVGTGWANLAQNGLGINSSYAATDATLGNYYTTVGVMNGQDAIDYSVMSVFGTHTVAGTDTLFKWTYYGDSNFDGKVNEDDLGFINYSYGMIGTPDEGSLKGWMWGDFNNSGAINEDDLGYMNYLYGAGGQPYGVLSAGGLTAVPEPSTIMLLISSVACALFVYLRKR